MRENQGEECHSAHFPNSELIIPPWSKSDPGPSVHCMVRGKEPQMTVTPHFYTAWWSPVMTYTDDARDSIIKTLNVIAAFEHRNNWREMGGGKLGTLIALQAYEASAYKNKNVINQAKGTVGSMWHSPPGSPAWPSWWLLYLKTIHC